MAGRKQPELQMIIYNFYQRLMESSRDSNILKALKSENQNRYDDAINYYNQEFETEGIFGSIQNQFFTATSIKRLCKIFPNKNYKQYLQKCEAFFNEIETENGENDDGNYIGSLEDDYHERKKYLIEIIRLVR